MCMHQTWIGILIRDVEIGVNVGTGGESAYSWNEAFIWIQNELTDMQWFDLACRPHRWWHHWKSVKVPVPVLPHKWCNQIVDMVHCKGFEKGAPTAYGWNALPLLNSFFRQIDRFCTLLESYDMRSMGSIFGPKLKEQVTNSPCVWLRNVVAQIFLFFKILCTVIQ